MKSGGMCKQCGINPTWGKENNEECEYFIDCKYVRDKNDSGKVRG